MTITTPAPTPSGGPAAASTEDHFQATGNVAGISQEQWVDLASEALGPASYRSRGDPALPLASSR